ncbi:MAG TPA: hypothetical protein VIW46_10640 [Acidimicrobiia bacterium]
MLGDPDLPDRSKPGGRFTPDDLDQIVRLKTALGEIGAYRFEYLDDHEQFLHDLHKSPPEFVLNFCDTGYRNEAGLELHVASYLEMLSIPYSGSGPVALGLCYDKALVRALAQSLGIPVPRETFLRPDDTPSDLAFPAFVKPNRGPIGNSNTQIAQPCQYQQLDELVAMDLTDGCRGVGIGGG